jgi:hypothetical protein
MFAILRGQSLDGQWRQTGETADIAAVPIPEGSNRIGGTAGGVKPTFQGRGTEADIQPGYRMAPGFGGERL